MSTSGGTLVGLAPPGYAAGSGLPYLPSRNVGNFQPSIVHKLRADIYAAASGALRHWAVLGDSLPGGFNGVGNANDQELAFPAQLLAFLIRDYPGMIHGGVGARPMVAALGVLAAGWGMTGGFNATSGAFGFTSTGGTATYTSPQNASACSAIYHGQSSAFTVKVGAGAANPVTPSGLAQWEAFTLTGQTIVPTTPILVTAGAIMELDGVILTNSSGLVLHNLGYGGARLNSGTNAVNWSDYSAVTTMASARMAMLPSGVTVAMMEGGANDIAVGTAPATAVAGVGNILARSQLAGAVPVEILSWCQSGTAAAAWAAFCTAMWADTAARGGHILDWNDRVQGQAGAQADGVLGPDNTHPTYALSGGLGKSASDLYLS